MTEPVRASKWGRPLLLALLAVALALVVARLLGGHVPDAALWATLIVLQIAVFVGVRFPALGMFARPILAGQVQQPVVALTFDDGPHPQHTRHVLDLLAASGHRATFFVIGQRAQEQPELLTQIVQEGHGLGNHTWRHSYLTPALPARRLEAELRRTGELLAQFCGHAPRWFRPPVGLVSPPVGLAAARAGLEVVIWTETARDGVAWADAGKGLERLRKHLKPGAILVLHDGVHTAPGQQPAVYALLPRLLAELDARGLRSVTLDALLGGK